MLSNKDIETFENFDKISILRTKSKKKVYNIIRSASRISISNTSPFINAHDANLIAKYTCSDSFQKTRIKIKVS